MGTAAPVVAGVGGALRRRWGRTQPGERPAGGAGPRSRLLPAPRAADLRSHGPPGREPGCSAIARRARQSDRHHRRSGSARPRGRDRPRLPDPAFQDLCGIGRWQRHPALHDSLPRGRGRRGRGPRARSADPARLLPVPRSRRRGDGRHPGQRLPGAGGEGDPFRDRSTGRHRGLRRAGAGFGELEGLAARRRPSVTGAAGGPGGRRGAGGRDL